MKVHWHLQDLLNVIPRSTRCWEGGVPGEAPYHPVCKGGNCVLGTHEAIAHCWQMQPAGAEPRFFHGDSILPPSLLLPRASFLSRKQLPLLPDPLRLRDPGISQRSSGRCGVCRLAPRHPCPRPGWERKANGPRGGAPASSKASRGGACGASSAPAGWGTPVAQLNKRAPGAPGGPLELLGRSARPAPDHLSSSW